jgi:predicted nucleotidyltransferase component of viral defense system
VIYETDAAFRAALEARLATRSRESGVDLNRLRRRVVFERLLARLDRADPGRWVLKGGLALEVRWRDRARATRDLDLAVRHDVETADDVRAALARPLAEDADRDRFRFKVGEARPLQADEAGRPGWRLAIEATLAGRQFASVSVDVVVRPDEITRTERLLFPGSLAFAGIEASEVEIVDRAQHFAEKLHALTRSYQSRPSTRVKDLADLVLLIDDGLQPSATLLDTVHHVFASRATHPLPSGLVDPPADWVGRYAELASELDVSAGTLGEAMVLLRTFWQEVQSQRG